MFLRATAYTCAKLNQKQWCWFPASYQHLGPLTNTCGVRALNILSLQRVTASNIMQPKRVLQVASLLLLSAAVLGQVETSAAASIAALPAEVQPAAFNCFRTFGPDCLWGSSCDTAISNCQLCEPGSGPTPVSCAYCQAGYFRAVDGSSCTLCPFGAFW